MKKEIANFWNVVYIKYLIPHTKDNNQHNCGITTYYTVYSFLG